jgi:hypothetical protein
MTIDLLWCGTANKIVLLTITYELFLEWHLEHYI